MRRYRHSLELIILVPVVAFIIVAGAGLYVMILNSVEEFADHTIRQSFQSMSSGVRNIADRGVDQLTRTGQTENEKATRIRQVSALIEMEIFARENEVGIVIYAKDKSEALLVAGLPERVLNIVTKDSEFRQNKVLLSEDNRYYAHTPYRDTRRYAGQKRSDENSNFLSYLVNLQCHTVVDAVDNNPYCDSHATWTSHPLPPLPTAETASVIQTFARDQCPCDRKISDCESAPQ